MQNPDMPAFRHIDRLPYEAYWAVVLASGIVVCGALVATWHHVAFERRERIERNASVALAAMYAITLFVPELSGISLLALDVTALVCSGGLAAWLFVQWGTLVCARSPREALGLSSTALVVAFLLAALLYQLDRNVATTLLSFLPLFSVGILLSLRELGTLPDDLGLIEGDVDDGALAHRSLKLYMTVLVQGMALGLLHVLYGAIQLETCSDPYCPLRFLNSLFPLVSVQMFYGFMSVFGMGLAAVVAVVCANVLRLNFRRLIYVVGFPLMALGFLIIAADAGLRAPGASIHASGVNFTAGEVVYVAGYYYAVVTVWALCAYLVRTKREEGTALLAGTCLALLLGQLAGFVVSAAVGFQKVSLSSFCTVALFVLMLASLLIVVDDRLWSGWGGVRPTESDRPGMFKAACEALAAEYHLTPRERDVFVLLARGRNASFVADHLVVTKDTVKTHSRSLYRKLGVHSQQELIDKVEKEISTDRDQRIDGVR